MPLSGLPIFHVPRDLLPRLARPHPHLLLLPFRPYFQHPTHLPRLRPSLLEPCPIRPQDVLFSRFLYRQLYARRPPMRRTLRHRHFRQHAQLIDASPITGLRDRLDHLAQQQLRMALMRRQLQRFQNRRLPFAASHAFHQRRTKTHLPVLSPQAPFLLPIPRPLELSAPTPLPRTPLLLM